MLKLTCAIKCLNNHQHPQIHCQESLHFTITLTVLRGASSDSPDPLGASSDSSDPLGAGSVSPDPKVAGSVSLDPKVAGSGCGLWLARPFSESKCKTRKSLRNLGSQISAETVTTGSSTKNNKNLSCVGQAFQLVAMVSVEGRPGLGISGQVSHLMLWSPLGPR